MLPVMNSRAQAQARLKDQVFAGHLAAGPKDLLL